MIGTSTVSCGVANFGDVASLIAACNRGRVTAEKRKLLAMRKVVHAVMYADWRTHDPVRRKWAQIVFSDADVYGNGKQLAAAIREHFPESLLVETEAHNPNSGNLIRTWIWTLPSDADLIEFYNDNNCRVLTNTLT